MLLAMFAVNIILFSVALKGAFTAPYGVPPTMRLLAICGAAASTIDVFLLARTPVTMFSLVVSFLLLIVSQIVFQAALKATTHQKLSLAFSEDVPVFLKQEGIYKFIRHPFYLAYTLNWLGAVTATLHWGAFILLLVLGGFYSAAARREEQKFIRSPLKGQYESYRKKAGMFFPKMFFKV